MSTVEAITLEEVVAQGAPEFVSTDAASYKSKLIAKYQELTGRTLYEAQAEMFLIETIAYMLSIRGEEEQAAFEQNLIAFAVGTHLVNAATNNSTYQLQASHAVGIAEFTLAAVLNVSVTIPVGTRLTVSGSSIVFQTAEEAVVAPGDLNVFVPIEAEEAGSVGNGFGSQASLSILDPIAGVSGAALTVETGGGADIEDDDRLRDRAAHAHERISQAGPYEGYRQRVLSINPAIVDVEPVRPQPGYIELYILMQDGLPTETERQDVLNNLSRETDVPMGDYVSCLAPTPHDFTLEITVRAQENLTAIEAQALTRVQAVVDQWELSLGGYILPATITAAISDIAGVVDCATNLVFTEVPKTSFRNCLSIAITMEQVNV